MSLKRIFSKGFMQDVVLGNHGDHVSILEQVACARRHGDIWSVVFSFEGKCWTTTYSNPSAGVGELPFDYGYEEGVECSEVVAVEKTITVYEPADA